MILICGNSLGKQNISFPDMIDGSNLHEVLEQYKKLYHALLQNES